jgi:LuxR family maltose regulon positive regulatory protein
MADLGWLALTKLAPPELRPGVLPRPRLFDALRRALDTCPLTLISAPAGSGKTTLLADWLSELKIASAESRKGTSSGAILNSVAWLSIDEDDSDPARFFGAVSAALARGLPSLAPPEGGSPDQLRRWTARLINALLAAGERHVLVLDDLHWVADQAIFAALDQLIERMPAQLRVVIATRHDPPISLARLRVRRQVAEIHLGDLRFSADEAASWLNSALQLDIPAAQIAPLVERTGGWAAGISLVASSLEQIRTAADRAAFLDYISRSDRAIFEFLAEEVLNRQDPFARMFLLETAVLPTLTPTLCQAVTGRSDSEAILDTLYRRNLFLVALDDLRAQAEENVPPRSRSSYRYHDLFRDFLRDRLRRELPEWPQRLYRRAAAAEPDPARRVGLLLAGELWNEAAQAIGAVGDQLVRAGAFGLLQRWIGALPSELRESDPQLLLLAGICAWETYQLEFAQRLLTQALRRFEATGDQAGRATALARLTLAAQYTGDLAAGRELAAQALALPLAPDLEAQLRAIRGFELLQTGEWRTALSDLDILIELAERERRPELQRPLIAALELVLPGPMIVLPGGIERIERIERLVRAHPLAGEPGPVQLYLITVQINCSWRRGDWDSVLEQCAELYRLSEEQGMQAWSRLRVGGMPPICLAARGDLPAAEAAAADLLGWIDRIPSNIVIQQIPYHFWHARVRWHQGRHADVRAIYQRISEQVQAYTPPPLLLAIPPLLRGLVALAERRYDDAEQALREAAAIQERLPFSVIFSDANILLAYTALKRGRPAEALAIFAPLLAEHALANTPGHLMWEGPLAAALLRLAVERGLHASFAERTLRLLEPLAQRVVLPGGDEALSARELEVLRLLAGGSSNSEIAERLVISPHTAKRHVANILGKLGAATRTEAAARARELGLL